jgi:uncharacterized protein
MLKRILIVLTLSSSVVFAADSSNSGAAGNPVSEASVKQLLEVTHARNLVDTMMSQLDNIMKTAMQHATQGQPVSPEVQKTFDKCRADVVSVMKEQFTWDKLEPMYLRIYEKSFNQQEVDGMIAFYKTPAGQAVVNKMPVVMQNSMNETMQMMGPMMQRIQRMQTEMIAQIQAEKEKKSG